MKMVNYIKIEMLLDLFQDAQNFQDQELMGVACNDN